MATTSNKSFKLIMGAAITLVLIAALYVLFKLDPETHSLFPKCPFLLATGLECPGCGSQRAIHQLLHLNFTSAFRYNAFMVIALPYIFLGIYLQYFGGQARHPGTTNFFFGRWSALIVLILVFSYWIFRNIF